MVNLPDAEKDNFIDELRPEIPASGDWNGHVGKSSDGYDGVHGGHGWVTRNTEDESLQEFAMSCNLVNDNTCFKKRSNHLMTYTSGKGRAQIDFVLFHKTFCKHVRDVNVIPGEDIAKQHHLLVCYFRANIRPPAKKKFDPPPQTPPPPPPPVSVEKRPGGEMRVSAMQSRKDRDAENTGRKVEARRHIKRPSALTNMLSIW